MRTIVAGTGFFCLLIANLFAQQPFFRYPKLPEDWKDAGIKIIYEAPDGFLWIGTDKGLLRFDGLEFKPYRIPSSSYSQHVTAAFSDSRGLLWIGYQDGAVYTLKNGEELKLWEPEEGHPAAAITAFAQDQKGRLWLGTYGEGIYYTDNGHVYNLDSDDGLPAADIYTLVAGPDGKIWAGTDSGLSLCWLEDGKKRVRNLTRSDGLPDDIIRCILPVGDNKVWVGGFDGGVCRISAGDYSVEYPKSAWTHGVINALAIFKDLELWIGTEGNGVWRYHFEEGRYDPVDPARFGKAKVHDLIRDVEGNIWIASNEVPLASANRQFEFLRDGLQNIQAVLLDNQQKLWVGAQTGLYQYEKLQDGSGHFKLLLSGINVISLYDNKEGILWIGSFGEGLIGYDKNSGATRVFTEAEGLSNGNILSIAASKDKLWLGTFGGVSSSKLGANPFSGDVSFQKEEGLGANYIFKVYCDKKNRIWFGTGGNGLGLLEQGKIRYFDNAGGKPFKSVYSITEDHEGKIWFSTAEEGLFSFDGAKFEHFGVQAGLRGLSIAGLGTDAKGQILVIHPNGIDLLDPELKHFIYYDREVGLEEFGPYENAMCADDRGKIWIGAKDGVISFNPLSEPLSIHPRINIDKVSVFLEGVDFRTINSFPHNRNGLAFDFSGIWLTDPETVKFRYKLENYNREWIVTSDRRVIYSSLPPGDYRFVISASENGKFAAEPVASYAFTIRMPYWRKPWFIVSVTLIGFFLVYYIIQRREQRLKKEAALKREMVESQYQTLKSQINPHFLFNNFNTLVAIIEETPQLAVEYVEKLSDFYRHILQYREKDLIELEEELNLVKDYGFLLNKRFGDGLEMVVTDIEAPGYIAPLTLQMLVENAVKHNVISKSRPLKIEIHLDSEGYIVVCNNLQKKLSPEKSTGFGLQSIAKRYELLSNKKIRVEETPTHFKVFIPLIKNGNA